jgi:hypothetical protein
MTARDASDKFKPDVDPVTAAIIAYRQDRPGMRRMRALIDLDAQARRKEA